ncbi:hypothetical protein BaRGS_00010003 [Batillaria attramentaria]|uniref:Uncharacterized protein n=1 Tax=Batillaria attramentaria TaxID=370345 RepID=A0ABD0LHD9_9CAEN
MQQASDSWVLGRRRRYGEMLKIEGGGGMCRGAVCVVFGIQTIPSRKWWSQTLSLPTQRLRERTPKSDYRAPIGTSPSPGIGRGAVILPVTGAARRVRAAVNNFTMPDVAIIRSVCLMTHHAVTFTVGTS